MTEIYDNKEDVEHVSKYDALKTICEFDHDTGLSYDWLEVREQVMIHGVKALRHLFEYYQRNNTHFDEQLNYMCACSHFSAADLDLPTNRATRRALEVRIQKLLKLRSKKPNEPIQQFLRNNADMIIPPKH